MTDLDCNDLDCNGVCTTWLNQRNYSWAALAPFISLSRQRTLTPRRRETSQRILAQSQREIRFLYIRPEPNVSGFFMLGAAAPGATGVNLLRAAMHDWDNALWHFVVSTIRESLAVLLQVVTGASSAH